MKNISFFVIAVILASCADDKEKPIPVADIQLNVGSITMTVNGTLTLIHTVLPENASNKSVAWFSSNESVASVDGGIVMAKAAGTATITVVANDGGKQASCIVTVTVPAANPASIVSFSVSGVSYTINADNTITHLYPKISPGVWAGEPAWKVAPSIVLSSPKATVSPPESTPQNFVAGTVTYTVTAEDGSKKLYQVHADRGQ